MNILIQQKKHIALIFSVILLMLIVINMTACSVSNSKVKATNLMDGISSKTVDGKISDDKFISNTAHFSIELFKETVTDKKNSLISPLSVMLALAMTANGADNETLLQMERVLGNDISIENLNEYLYSYVNNLSSDKKSKLNIANSIWFRDNESRLMVEEGFLQQNANYYNADIYKSVFNDQTLQDINSWVNANTDGKIEKILDQINVHTIMYLINAIVFDAEWKTVYDKNSIYKGEFTSIDGNTQTVDFMDSVENTYLDDGKATGFVKPYLGDKYSFVALLPNKDVSIEDYIETLSGDGFLNTIKGAENTAISATLPKFSYDYTIKMNDALIALSMPDSFSPTNADFSKLQKSSSSKIYISEVLHKTFISVDELGTIAGAVTKVDLGEISLTKTTELVKLDRPFVYAIIDDATNLPIFIGTVMSLKE